MVEFAQYGNLSESAPHHSIERLWRFTIQAATALEHLEKKNVIHQSIHSYNFLVVAGHQVSSNFDQPLFPRSNHLLYYDHLEDRPIDLQTTASVTHILPDECDINSQSRFGRFR